MDSKKTEKQYQEAKSKALKDELYHRVTEEALKEINLEVTENEVKAVTRVLIDALDYYSSLPKREEQMKLLVKATEVSKKLTKSYYS